MRIKYLVSEIYILERVVIVRAEQQLTIDACSAEPANAAAHVQTVSCLVRAEQNYTNFLEERNCIKKIHVCTSMQLSK